jgi:site-specific DNA-cytosine methylase
MGGGHFPMTAVVERDEFTPPLPENLDMKKVSIISRPHGYFKGQEYTDIAPTVKARAYAENNLIKMEEPKILRSVRTEKAKELRRKGIERFADRKLVPVEEPISNTISTVQKDNLLYEPQVAKATEGQEINSPVASTHIAASPNNAFGDSTSYRIRKLTPRECFRLMDVSDEDIDKIQAAGISKSQQYKLAGNSIVCSVLYNIFESLFINEAPEKQSIPQQLELF